MFLSPENPRAMYFWLELDASSMMYLLVAVLYWNVAAARQSSPEQLVGYRKQPLTFPQPEKSRSDTRAVGFVTCKT